MLRREGNIVIIAGIIFARVKIVRIAEQLFPVIQKILVIGAINRFQVTANIQESEYSVSDPKKAEQVLCLFMVGVPGIEPGSQDPQPCIITIIRHPDTHIYYK